MNVKKAIVLAVFAITLFPSCKGCGKGKEKRKPVFHEDTFSFRTLDGKLHHFTDYKGKVLLLEFFASWCPSCRLSIAKTSELYEKYKSRGLVVVGLSFDLSDLDVIKKKFSVPFPVGYAPEALASHFRISSIPAFFIFDRNCRFAAKFIGYNRETEKAIEKKVKALIKGG